MDKHSHRLYHQRVNARAWYCVYLEHPRLVGAIDVTFRNMLLGEYIELGEPESCYVYRKTFPNQSLGYYFSPEAVELLEAFVNFWDGMEVPEPSNMDELTLLIP